MARSRRAVRRLRDPGAAARVSRPVRLVIVLALAAGAIALAVALTGGSDSTTQPSAKAKPAPADFIGIIPPGIASLNASQLGSNLDVVKRLHAGLLRQTFDWADIERAPGRFHW